MGEVLGKFSNTIFKQMQEVEKAEVHLLEGAVVHARASRESVVAASLSPCAAHGCSVTKRKRTLLGPYRRLMPRVIGGHWWVSVFLFAW